MNALSDLPATWVLTDGKAGDEAQCLGVTDAIGVAPEIRRVAPRALFALAMPWGPIDPAEAPGRPGSPIAPPFPDVLIASGRRAIPYVRAVKRASAGRTFTIILKDPRTGASAADLIWVPEHDRLRGRNVLTTVTGPHRVSAARLVRARDMPDPRLAGLPEPRVAVLVGGDSRHHRFKAQDAERLLHGLERLALSGTSLMITTSRRTPDRLASRLQNLVDERRGFFWNGTGENPYLALLALADVIVVTADSTNMIGEATATGKPVLVFEPSGGHAKITAYLKALTERGAVRPFAGTLEAFTYEPLDTTPAIAGAILAGLSRHRAAFGRTEADGSHSAENR
jgi:mitochondrial fission protein ELM1